MDAYRQWHETENTITYFNTESLVSFAQCDKNHKLSLAEILKLSSDAAVEDFNRRGISWNLLKDQNLAILVSRVSFKFHKLPEANQTIRIRTWAEKPLPLQFVRMYEFYDAESNEILISGTSYWLLVDTEKRRMMPCKNFTLLKLPEINTEHKALEPGKISVPENQKELCQRPIWYSDIDGNGHVNNSRYGAFVMDALPKDYQDKKFTDVKINFSKEAVQDQMIQISGTFDDENKKIIICGKQDGITCFESELYWE